jgi:hypothetical protein
MSDVEWERVAAVAVTLHATDFLRRRVVTYRYRDQATPVVVEEAYMPIHVPDFKPPSPSDQARDAFAEFQKHWDGASSQAQTTAKWMATILGAALGVLIGTAPLSNLQDRVVPASALYTAGAALLSIGVTLFLVLRVLVPNVTSFGDVIDTGSRRRRGWQRRAGRKFEYLRQQACRGGGVMLPIGISSLTELGWRSQVDNFTLNRIAQKIDELEQVVAAKTLDRVGRRAAIEQIRGLKNAQEVRGRWADYLRNEITQWTSIATYTVVRRSAGWARMLGLFCGLLATALIAWAFLQTHPKLQPAPLKEYHIADAPGDAQVAAAKAQLGAACASFMGVITAVDKASNTLSLLVQPSERCQLAQITVPAPQLALGPSPQPTSR